MEVEVLMKRMVELQQQEEECTQEEMLTRFERERSESIPTGIHSSLRAFIPVLYISALHQWLVCLC